MNMSSQELYSEMASKTAEYFECQMPILDQTEKAICFDASNSHLSSNHRKVWVPKSQMVIIPFEGDCDTRYFVKNWLYSKLQ